MSVSKYDPIPEHTAKRTHMWKANEGNCWNPLKRFPRNSACFCGSGFKHKKCCAPYVGEFTTLKSAQLVNQKWESLLDGSFTIQVRPKK